MQKLFRENGNIIYLETNSKMNAVVTFRGRNNILFLSSNANLCANIEFAGDNSLVFIGQTRLKGRILIFTDCVFYVGNHLAQSSGDTLFNITHHCIIGDDCLFSWGIVCESSDHHPIFDAYHKILNVYDRNIYIGDHVWIGQHAWLFKGTFLASGCIMGAKSIATRVYDSNTTNVGIPAKTIKKCVHWTGDVIKIATKDKIATLEKSQNDTFKYRYCPEEFLSPKSISHKLDSMESAQERLEFVYTMIYCNHSKNRFAYSHDCKYAIPLPQAKNKKQFQDLMRFFDSKLTTITNASYTTTSNSATTRIHSHLAYKLGSAMILNSKSLLGYIRMPYVLSYIKESHREEQQKYQERIKKNPKLKLPKLESYPDYQEALKEKQCFTYQLGEAFMQATKDWVKGGYLRFYFKELPRLKREFRGKRE